MPAASQHTANDRRIAVADLDAGYVCTQDVLDHAGRVLLTSGMLLTRNFIERLKARGIVHIQVGVRDFAKLNRGVASIPAARQMAIAKHAQRVDRSQEPHSSLRAVRFTAQLDNALNLLDCIESDALDMSAAPMAALCRVPEVIADMLIEDSDQAILASHRDEHAQKLSARSAQLSVLASAIAMEMRLPDSDVELVGLAGLLHDLGLFLLPLELRDGTRVLNAAEAELYRSHPKLTVNLLSDCDSISESVKLLILQVHELPDGSGFPRGLKKHLLHPLTCILNAADIFLSLISPSPGRPAIIPHDAISILLHQCRAGLIQADVMRAMINQLTLFPLGSRVQLDDHSVALIARRDGEHYDAPIVVLEGAEGGPLISLRGCERKILSPHYNPEHEMRIGREQLAGLTLDSLMMC